jgi:hypothetical protein
MLCVCVCGCVLLSTVVLRLVCMIQKAVCCFVFALLVHVE